MIKVKLNYQKLAIILSYQSKSIDINLLASFTFKNLNILISIDISMQARQIPQLDHQKSSSYISKVFDQKVVPSLCQFISIPNKSRNYDPQWYTNGLLEKAAQHLKDFVEGLAIKGLKSQIIKDQGYSPVLFTQIEGDIKQKTVFFYGHFDKQPDFTGWDANKQPTKPVIENGKLYGRGGADDGYSTYSSMLAIKAVQQQGLPIPRCVMITEGDQESGNHIDHYIETLKGRIGNPEVVFCLDSGVVDYQRIWLTNSLRGYCGGVLTIKVLKQGVHSGDSSGIVPSCFRIFNMLIDRLENPQNGKVHKDFTVQIPPNRYQQTVKVFDILGQNAVRYYPTAGDTKYTSENIVQLLLNRTWRPQLTVTGITNLPEVKSAGNVMIPQMQFKFSLRLPPTMDPKKAKQSMIKILTENPPFNAQVSFTDVDIGAGWNAPSYQAWLSNALQKSSQIYFGKTSGAYGEGGSIPLMGLLSSIWPKAQFLVTGVLGPESNAHGPNQFLHLQYCKKLTQAMAYIVSESGRNLSK